MNYCRETTINHRLSKSHPTCLIGLNEITIKEGKKNCTDFKNEQIALDLDMVEVELAKKECRNRRETCDCTIGIKADKTPKMLLIEYRLNYKSPKNISETQLDDKVRNSTNMLGQEPAIFKSVFFIFKDSIVSEAYRLLRRMKNNKKEYIAVSVRHLSEILKMKTLIIGASKKPERYSYKAADKLLSYGHEIELLGLRADTIFGKVIDTEKKQYTDIDTVTLYVGPQRQTEYYDYIVSLKPRRVIFNPGTENEEFYEILKKNNIESEVACTLVLLSTNQY